MTMTTDIRVTGLFILSGLFVVALIGSLWKMKDGFGPFNLKVFGLTLVLGVTGILVLTDIESSKLTAAFGIVGTIAGYLFGLKKE